MHCFRWRHHGFAGWKPAKADCGKLYYGHHHRGEQRGDVGHFRANSARRGRGFTAVYSYDRQMAAWIDSCVYRKLVQVIRPNTVRDLKWPPANFCMIKGTYRSVLAKKMQKVPA